MRLTRLLVAVVFAAACSPSDKEDAKGQVDESEPPGLPSESGKADASQKVVAVDVQSAHPYGNDTDRTYSVSLAALPSCAQEARLHFKVLRTEANYDFVTVQATGEEFSGDRDDTWTEWFTITGTTARVRLESDYSITRHGFEIDKVEWEGLPSGCPLVRFPPCADDHVDVQEEPGVCECSVAPVCEPVASVEVAHHVARGFNNTTKRVQGTVATYTHPGPADGPETDTIGTVDPAKVRDLVRRAAALGLLQGPGYNHTIAPGGTLDEFTISAGSYSVSFVSTQGTHSPQVQSLIDELEAVFSCGTTAGGLTCGSGYVCNQGTCEVDQSCVCPAIYDPVCGENGRTYSNACDLGCAGVGQAHAGECGEPGDTCGTIMGLVCKDDNKCRFGDSQFTYPYPDAGGTCVAPNYCDAPADCNGLIHPAVVGAWACNANTCAWQAGPAWQTLDHFETTNPYTNNMSVWHQAYLPTDGQAMRLRTTRFATEANYDKLEVWSWKNGSWIKVATYTGTAGPALTTEFAGQYHYLKFVSDSSVTKAGVSLDVEWR
jgi:hypothetical protein